MRATGPEAGKPSGTSARARGRFACPRWLVLAGVLCAATPGTAVLGLVDSAAAQEVSTRFRSAERSLHDPAPVMDPLARPRRSTAAPRTRSSDDLDPDAAAPTALLVGAGIAGGALGVLAGTYLGAWVGSESCRPGDECFAETVSGAAVGMAAGESLLLSLGVHLANRRSGSYPLSAATAAGLAVGGLGLLHLTHYDPPWAPAILVGVPVLQLAAAVTIERR